MKKQNFTRKEVIRLLDKVYWDGVETENDSFAGEFFIVDDYFKEFDNEEKKII